MCNVRLWTISISYPSESDRYWDKLLAVTNHESGNFLTSRTVVRY